MVSSLPPPTVWVPTSAARSRDREPVLEGGAGRQLWEGGGGGWGGPQCEWQRGKRPKQEWKTTSSKDFIWFLCIFCICFLQDLENQMHIAEQRRRTLLKDFHDTWGSDCNCRAPASPSSPFSCFLPWLSLGAATLICFSPLVHLHPFIFLPPPLISVMLQAHRMSRPSGPAPSCFICSSCTHVLVFRALTHHGYTCFSSSDLLMFEV